MREQDEFRFNPHVRHTLARINRIQRQVLENMGIVVVVHTETKQ
jgi:hypothetical protein